MAEGLQFLVCKHLQLFFPFVLPHTHISPLPVSYFHRSNKRIQVHVVSDGDVDSNLSVSKVCAKVSARLKDCEGRCWTGSPLKVVMAEFRGKTCECRCEHQGDEEEKTPEDIFANLYYHLLIFLCQGFITFTVIIILT